MQKKWIWTFIVAAFWLVCWQIAAWCIGNEILLSGPVSTIVYLGKLLLTSTFWQICANSFIRITGGFLLALLAGCLLGMAAFKCTFIKKMLSPFFTFCKSVPVASFAVILLVWWGADWLSFAICFLVTVPLVYVNFLEGMCSVDEKMLQMALSFETPVINKFFSVYRQALMPFMEGCFKTAPGMGMKAGVAAEVIGIAGKSVGGEIYLSKIYLDTTGVFAWTIVVILLACLTEKGILAVWKWFCSLQIPKAKKKDNREKLCDIKITNLQKYFGNRSVLKNISVKLYAGEIYCLMAPSGFGKTTLLHVLAGLLKPDGGSISAWEQGMQEKRTVIKPAVVFQEDRLIEEETALQNLMFTGCEKEIAEECLHKLLPEEAFIQPVKNLSGGMRRRVCIARALVSEGNVLLFDEPFTGLDEDMIQQSCNVILEYQRGRLVILATHEKKDKEKLRGKFWRLS